MKNSYVCWPYSHGFSYSVSGRHERRNGMLLIGGLASSLGEVHASIAAHEGAGDWQLVLVPTAPSALRLYGTRNPNRARRAA